VRLFHNSNDLVKGFKELIQPDVRYLLAFSSDAPRHGRYHPLKVKLTAPNHYEIEARRHRGSRRPSCGRCRRASAAAITA
jgi:hypothetical protein